MKSFLDPGSVVLIGVTRRNGSGAYNGLQMMRRYGYAGQVYLVHPSVDEIVGEPTCKRVAERMLDELRIAPVLRGLRGQPAVDREGLVAALLTLSELTLERPEIKELDLNPVLASQEGCFCVDARIIT